jgi:hypothetical protein
MKRIELHLDDLCVESFATTSGAAAHRGTVHGADASDTTCVQRFCGCETYGPECETSQCDTEWDCTVQVTCGDSCSFYCSQTCPLATCAYSCLGTCGETTCC